MSRRCTCSLVGWIDTIETVPLPLPPSSDPSRFPDYGQISTLLIFMKFQELHYEVPKKKHFFLPPLSLAPSASVLWNVL
jgi:hypothetical protein